MSDPNKLDMHEQRQDTEPDVDEMHQVAYREKTEPREGGQPVPTELIVAAFALLLFGGWYLGNYSADFAVDRYEGPAAFTGGGSGDRDAKPTVIDPMLMGKRIFNSCAACHQARGQGVAGQYPPLDGNPIVHGRADNLARIVLHGLTGPIEVDGKSYNGQMPKWSQFDDQSLAAVLTYIRGSWSNSSAPVSEELVAAVRKATSGRAAAWTADELESARLIEVEQKIETDDHEREASPGPATGNSDIEPRTD